MEKLGLMRLGNVRDAHKIFRKGSCTTSGFSFNTNVDDFLSQYRQSFWQHERQREHQREWFLPVRVHATTLQASTLISCSSNCSEYATTSDSYYLS
jgi:hypothetical protein